MNLLSSTPHHPELTVQAAELRVRIGTRIGTRRISIGREGAGQLDRKAGESQKTLFFGTRWYEPGRH